MARPNSRPQDDRRADMPREAPQPAQLTYPKIAEEYGIDKPLWLSLMNLYPGAQPESVVMVYEYCKHRQLDPLKKPVHIVPMQVEDKATGRKVMRDVIMPGIQEMRTTASRTAQYAGIDPPKFGPMIEVEVQNKGKAEFRNIFMAAPEWCEITVYRLVQGKRYGFTHIEYFEEAVARNSYGEVNAMWRKRSRGQLSKCAEAGALRKAFPEELGGEYAAEELEGQEYAEPMGLPADDHGASGIPAPQADTAPAITAGEAKAAADVAERELDRMAGGDLPADPAQSKPADDVTRVITPEERAEFAKAKAEADAAKAAKPANEPDPKPAAQEPLAPAVSDYKVELPEGANRILRAQMEARNVSEAQLLAKLGADVTTKNINVALAALKSWEA